MACLPALLGLLALACCSTVHALSPIGTVGRPATPLPQRMGAVVHSPCLDTCHSGPCPPRPASVLLGHPLMRLLGNVSPFVQASTCHGWMCLPLTLAARGQLQRLACSPTCSRCAQASRQHSLLSMDSAGQATFQPSHVHGCLLLAAIPAAGHAPLTPSFSALLLLHAACHPV